MKRILLTGSFIICASMASYAPLPISSIPSVNKNILTILFLYCLFLIRWKAFSKAIGIFVEPEADIFDSIISSKVVKAAGVVRRRGVS